jgi:hypothetical protein
MSAVVPGRRSRAWLTALAQQQGQGEGLPFYRSVPRYDQFVTGAVVTIPEESATQAAPIIPPPPQTAPMPASGPAHRPASYCGCTACGMATGQIPAGVSG